MCNISTTATSSVDPALKSPRTLSDPPPPLLNISEHARKFHFAMYWRWLYLDCRVWDHGSPQMGPKYDDYLISHSWIIAVAHVQANPRPSNQLLDASYDNGNSFGLTLRNMVVNIPEKGATRQTASQMRHVTCSNQVTRRVWGEAKLSWSQQPSLHRIQPQTLFVISIGHKLLSDLIVHAELWKTRAVIRHPTRPCINFQAPFLKIHENPLWIPLHPSSVISFLENTWITWIHLADSTRYIGNMRHVNCS